MHSVAWPQCTRKGRYRDLAQHLYPIPCPLDTEAQYLQGHHADLLHMSHAQLLWHKYRLRQRLAVEHDRDPVPWLIELSVKIDEALRHARR